MLGRADVSLTAQESVDVARRLLAVAHGGGHGARAAYKVAAGEDTRMSGVHGGIDFDHIVAADVDAGHRLEELDVGMLADGEHQRVGLELLELPGVNCAF